MHFITPFRAFLQQVEMVERKNQGNSFGESETTVIKLYFYQLFPNNKQVLVEMDFIFV